MCPSCTRQPFAPQGLPRAEFDQRDVIDRACDRRPLGQHLVERVPDPVRRQFHADRAMGHPASGQIDGTKRFAELAFEPCVEFTQRRIFARLGKNRIRADCDMREVYRDGCFAGGKFFELGDRAIDIVLGILRRRGFRINLRFIAEYSMMVLLFIGYYILKFVLRVLFF